MKQHDEDKDVRLVSRSCRVNTHDKTIEANKSTNIGIRTWGRIDFLTKYRGWHFIWNNDAKPSNSVVDAKLHSREAKKAAKEPKLTDKTKRK